VINVELRNPVKNRFLSHQTVSLFPAYVYASGKESALGFRQRMVITSIRDALASEFRSG
jgi:hypothetical protein